MDGTTTGITFTPDGRKLVAVGGQMIRFVDLQTGAVGPVIVAKGRESVTSVVYHNKDRTIITTETTGVRIRDGATGAIVPGPYHSWTRCLSHSARTVCSWPRQTGGATSWSGNTPPGTQRWALKSGATAENRGLCFVAHSHWLATGGGDGTLRFWDMRTAAGPGDAGASGQRAAVIAPAGDLRVSDPSAEDELVYLVQEKKDGPVACLTPREFRARRGKAVIDATRKPSGPGRQAVK